MAKKSKIKDTDYLFLSAYIHARETKLVGRERLERMVDARTPDEAEKMLEECGWPPFDARDAAALEQVLAAKRDEVFNDMRALAPDSSIVDVFRIKYDYHNAKVLLKAEALARQADTLLLGAGRIAPSVMKECVLSGDYAKMPAAFAAAYADAKDTLARTGDPQIADFILDQAYFQELSDIAREAGSAFLSGYVRLLIDTANLRAVVRARRTGKSQEFVRIALNEGGSVAPSSILNLWEQGDVLALFATTGLHAALEPAAAAMAGGRLTAFEKACDDALTAYVAEAKRAGFNERPLVGYIYAVETEISAVRVVLTGKLAGLSPETIKDRLREGF